MFVKEDKRGQHYYSLIFCISQREYKKISEASSHVNVWEEPEDGFSSVSYQKQLSLTSAGMFSNWSSEEVADWSNKTFFWCFSSGSGSFHLLTKRRSRELHTEDTGGDGTHSHAVASAWGIYGVHSSEPSSSNKQSSEAEQKGVLCNAMRTWKQQLKALLYRKVLIL